MKESSQLTLRDTNMSSSDAKYKADVLLKPKFVCCGSNVDKDKKKKALEYYIIAADKFFSEQKFLESFNCFNEANNLAKTLKNVLREGYTNVKLAIIYLCYYNKFELSYNHMINARACYIGKDEYIDYLGYTIHLTKLFKEREKENINNYPERLLKLAFNDIVKNFKDIILSKKIILTLSKEENEAITENFFLLTYQVKEEYENLLIASNDFIKTLEINEAYIEEVLRYYENKQKLVLTFLSSILLFIITQINLDNNFNDIKDKANMKIRNASILLGEDKNFKAKIEIVKQLIISLNMENSNGFYVCLEKLDKEKLNKTIINELKRLFTFYCIDKDSKIFKSKKEVSVQFKQEIEVKNSHQNVNNQPLMVEHNGPTEAKHEPPQRAISMADIEINPEDNIENNFNNDNNIDNPECSNNFNSTNSLKKDVNNNYNSNNNNYLQVFTIQNVDQKLDTNNADKDSPTQMPTKISKMESSQTNHLFDISEYSNINLDVRFAEDIL